MKTFTNCAEKKAKQILNLLQGYTKGIRMTAILVLLLMGVSNAWGWDNSWGTGMDHNVNMPSHIAGFNTGISQEVSFNINGTSSTLFSPDNQIGQDRDISPNAITSQLKITGYKTYMYHKNQHPGQDNNGANIKTSEMSWNIYHANGTLVSNNTYTGKYLDEDQWNNNEQHQRWGGNDQTYDLLSGITASTSEPIKYTIDFYFKATANWYNNKGQEWGTADNIWYPGNSQNFKYQFTIPETTLTLRTTGANGKASISSGINNSIELHKEYSLTASEVTGYTFVNWTTSSQSINITNATSRTGAKVKFASFTSATVTANYKVNTSTITWNANGGSVTPASSTYTYDGAAVTLPTPTRNGYTFNGWYTAASGGTKITEIGTTNKPASNTTYYAQWTENRYIVNIVANPAEAAKTLTLRSQQVGINPVSIATTAKVGYTFKSWTATAGITIANANNASTTITATKAGTVTANFEAQPATTIYLEPTGYWNSDNPQYVAHVWKKTSVDVNEDIIMEGVGESPYKYYKAEVPYGYTNVVFFRKSTNGTIIWNQTEDLTIPTDNNTLYEIKSTGEGTTTKADGDWKDAYLFYTITLNFCDFGTYGIKYNGQSFFSKPNDNVTIDLPAGAEIEILEGQPHSNAYTGDVYILSPTVKDVAAGEKITITGDITFEDNFVTKESHIVYLGVPNDLTAWNVKENNIWYYIWRFTTKENIKMVEELDRGELAFEDAINGFKYYKFTISAGCNKIMFQHKQAAATVTRESSISLLYGIPLTEVNCFTLDGNEKNGYFTGSWNVLPAREGDYRLLYVEQVVEKDANGNTVVTRMKAHPSDIIRKRTESGVDTVSLHTYKDRKYAAKLGDGSTYESSNNPEIILQRCTGFVDGKSQWEDVECQMVYGPLETLPIMANLPGRKNASPNSNIDDLQYQDGIEIIKKDLMPNGHPDKGNGVWNFVVKQVDGKASVQWNETHRYTGEYYIRTDNAEGGWDQYTLNDNYMTRSDVSKQHSNYSHYYCKWIGEAGVNVKYTIANDYGIAISDTLEADKTDLWGNELATKMVGDDQLLPAKANVRFSWNEKTNGLHRAYIAGTTNVADRFLVLEGDANIFDATGSALNVSGLKANEQIFRYNSNWIYYADVQMKPMAPVKVTAKYDGHTQYFIGKQNETVTLLQGTGEEKYLIRMLYDFKTNQLISAYVPGASDKVNAISTNLMLIRQDDKDATQLEFNKGTPLDMETIATDRRAYGVIEFTKKRLINGLNEKDEPVTELQKGLYWISFPFDVDLSEVISFGEYGKHWVIEEYDGATRAAKGCWLESESFWIYHWDQNITLEAGKGYVIGLDVDLIRNDNLFGLSGDRPIGIYFPSKTPVNQKIVNQTTAKTYVEPHECGIVRNTPKGDRRIADSHWNVVGTPSYVNTMGNYNNFTANIETKPQELKYYYEWLGEYNHYEPVAAESQIFKPLRAYMVQYAGYINWESIWNVHPAAIAAKQSSDDIKEHRLRLEIQQNGNKADHTFVRLQDEDGVTDHFDFNHDLCKIINAGANIYSFVTTETYPIEVAANVLPIQETVIPLGVVSAAAGEYTFAMPDGTDGIVVELIDYETNTRTNMLLDEYTVNLGKGTFENRFALHVKPNKTTTSLEDVNTNTTGVKKYLIDGILYMQKDGVLYDAQGKLVR